MKIEELAACVTANVPALSNEAIESFERSTGCDFPEDYKSFLRLTRGGGEVSLGSVEYLEFKKSKMTYNPSVFCTPGTGEYHHIRSLQRHFEDLEHQVADVPDGIFTIADDMMGNFLTIDLRPNSLGQIAVVNHETIRDNFSDPENYEILASSFSEFVKMCRIAKEFYLFKVGDEEEIEILDASEIQPLIMHARLSGKVASMKDETGRWVAFRPKNQGGQVFKVFGGSRSIWQLYYPSPTEKSEFFDPDLTIIDPDHAALIFQELMGRSNDLEIRARETK
jgi:cell wall assembly regulator SMI1